jgi:hypothetical protein
MRRPRGRTRSKPAKGRTASDLIEMARTACEPDLRRFHGGGWRDAARVDDGA